MPLSKYFSYSGAASDRISVGKQWDNNVKNTPNSGGCAELFNVNWCRNVTSLFILLVTSYFCHQENVEHWLDELGLGEYWPTFESNGYAEPSDLEDLKTMDEGSLEEVFNICKSGHMTRLISAIRKLQYPNQGK